MEPINYNNTPDVNILNTPKQKHVSLLVIFIGILLGLFVIILDQKIVGDIYNGFFQCSDSVSGANCLSNELGGLISNVIINIPLILLSLFLFIFFNKENKSDPKRVLSIIFFVSMIINGLSTLYALVVYLNTINSNITSYIIYLVLIIISAVAIYKVQEGFSKEKKS